MKKGLSKIQCIRAGMKIKNPCSPRKLGNSFINSILVTKWLSFKKSIEYMKNPSEHVKNTHGGAPPGCFSRILNCTNDTKLRNASHLWYTLHLEWESNSRTLCKCFTNQSIRISKQSVPRINELSLSSTPKPLQLTQFKCLCHG